MAELRLPADKHDLASARGIVAAGLDRVLPQLPEVLEWFQDINWPVARELLPLFADAGVEVVPSIEAVFLGDDDVHKYWVLQVIVPILSAEAKSLLRGAIQRIASSPSSGEVAEEVQLEATEFLQKQGLAIST